MSSIRGVTIRSSTALATNAQSNPFADEHASGIAAFRAVPKFKSTTRRTDFAKVVGKEERFGLVNLDR